MSNKVGPILALKCEANSSRGISHGGEDALMRRGPNSIDLSFPTTLQTGASSTSNSNLHCFSLQASMRARSVVSRKPEHSVHKESDACRF